MGSRALFCIPAPGWAVSEWRQWVGWGLSGGGAGLPADETSLRLFSAQRAGTLWNPGFCGGPGRAPPHPAFAQEELGRGRVRVRSLGLAPAERAARGGGQTESLSSFPLGPPGGGCVHGGSRTCLELRALFERPAPPQLPRPTGRREGQCVQSGESGRDVFRGRPTLIGPKSSSPERSFLRVPAATRSTQHWDPQLFPGPTPCSQRCGETEVGATCFSAQCWFSSFPG